MENTGEPTLNDLADNLDRLTEELRNAIQDHIHPDEIADLRAETRDAREAYRRAREASIRSGHNATGPCGVGDSR